MNTEDFKAFAPRPDGKFSPNLYKHLPKLGLGFRVFHLSTSRTDGKPTTPGVWESSDLWIGDADDCFLNGNSLRELISDRRPTLGWALPAPSGTYRDITVEFWERYRAIGRCAWDAAHRTAFQGQEGRYTVIGRTRRCNWCGAWHHAVTHKRVRISRDLAWLPAMPTVGAKASV
jgi:hypothetical protein